MTCFCSLSLNGLKAEGAKYLSDGLKENKGLTALECAVIRPSIDCEPFTPSVPADAGLRSVCSVRNNGFGPEGAKYFSDMLRVNTTLQSVKYAAKLAKLSI